ncbi:MAG TPA: vitamin K epoxide reductase family protein [Rhodothermales bacterium]|nr:vitamin K epoxide reductase family protein [Rhodothermales bacterium]
MPEASIPPGWNYNPSSWGQRLPLVGVALVGFGIASYLTLYQIHVVSHVWDPFFGAGTEKVLTSRISRMLPIPDAALGAFGYLMDAVSGAVGPRRRWQKMPWIVLLFGLAVGPLGVVSIGLVMSQPLIVGHWCTLCLCSAIISVVMIGPALDEVLASLQYLQRVKHNGRSIWRAFWGTAEPQAETVPERNAGAAGIYKG